MEYKIQNGQVRVIPEATYDSEHKLVTRRYRVPSNFVSNGGNLNQNGGVADPFADGAESGKPKSAKDVLEWQGVTFPPGADVAFDSSSGELTVRTTEDQMELTELVLDSLTGSDLSGRVNGNFSGALGSTDTETDRVMLNEQKVKRIIIPSVEFVDTPLKDALEFLRQRSVELDTNESDPSRKGVNFVLDSGINGGAAAPAPPAEGGFGVDGGVGNTRITLRLQNVPLVEALRYTTSLAQLKYKVEPNAIVILPLSRPDESLYTNVYTVPPTFLSAGSGVGGGGSAAADPFAEPADVGNGAVSARMSAQGVLEAAGVTFPPGGSASYNPQTGKLIIRTTQDQL
jgi:hypothetical protein